MRYFNAGWAGGPLDTHSGQASSMVPIVEHLTNKAPKIPDTHTLDIIDVVKNCIYKNTFAANAIMQVLWESQPTNSDYHVRQANPYYFAILGQFRRTIKANEQ